ncbi:M56 family metallopeptidase [Runella sp. SP2]|uniref:M56 family metallopeptidase n=1 Tax=Runella sp. SP2 TaxID=2268026 RepID=UPI000F0868E5|nr:M56 family metallopeptidase [Runella sp. SP2]AYQ31025.1 hypothetical protein DTQ70_02010 [Runella sp. SP2]
MLLLLYLLKVSACLGLFYGLYYFLFRRFTFHRLNRIYLLLTLLLSFLIPWVEIEQKRIVEVVPVAEEPVTSPQSEVFEQSVQSLDGESSQLINSKLRGVEPIPEKKYWFATLTWEQGSIVGYVMGLLVSLVVLTRRLWKIALLSKKRQNDANKDWVEVSEPFTAASFFGVVFMNSQALTEEETQQVLLHEQMHARLFHSVDVLLIELCKVILWFNPAIYFYKKSLAEIHEYEVDAQLAARFDAKTYAYLILKLATQSSHSLVHSFGKHPVTNRIHFLFQKPTSAMKKLLYAFGLPLGVAGVLAFAPRKEVLVYNELPATTTPKEVPAKTYPLRVHDNNLATERTESMKKQRRLKPFEPQKTAQDERLPDENSYTEFNKIVQEMRSKDIFFKRVEITSKTDGIKEMLIFARGGEGTTATGLVIGMGKSPIYYLDGMKVQEEVVKSLKPSHIKKVDILEPEYNRYPAFVKKHKLDVKNEKIVWMERKAFDFKKVPAPKLEQKLSLRSGGSVDTIRTFLPANELGTNPLVFINGEEFPASVLTRVDPSKFGMTYIAKPNDSKAILKYGIRAVDGVVDIKTIDDCFFKTEQERMLAVENMRKMLNTTNKRLSKRFLKNNEGNEVMMIVVRGFVYDQPFFSGFEKNAKLIYMLDGKPVQEEEINRYEGKFYSAVSWKKSDSKSKFEEQHAALIDGYDGGIALKTTR